MISALSSDEIVVGNNACSHHVQFLCSRLRDYGFLPTGFSSESPILLGAIGKNEMSYAHRLEQQYL